MKTYSFCSGFQLFTAHAAIFPRKDVIENRFYSVVSLNVRYQRVFYVFYSVSLKIILSVKAIIIISQNGVKKVF